MSVNKDNGTEALWNAFLKGEDKAFAGIYYAFINSLLLYGKKLSRDRELLHDSVQEIFMDLYQKRNNSKVPILNPKAYLFIALRNSILKKLQQNRKFEDEELNDNTLGEFNIEYSFQEQLISREISEEKRRRLHQAIVTLSPGQKEIIYLKFEENLGYKEISELMGISIESARKQLYRALLSLRETLSCEAFLTLFTFFLKKSKNLVHETALF